MDHVTELRQSVTKFAETIELPPFVNKLNELLNQRAWEQAAIEEKIAMQKIADIWAIVQEVATTSSTYYDDRYGWHECPFCDGADTREEADHIKHAPDCIVMKARGMIEKPEQGA